MPFPLEIDFPTDDLRMKYKIAINACGLHTGGGIQVATSFIQELCGLETQDLDLYIFASSDIDRNLAKVSTHARSKANYKVEDLYGLSAFSSPLNKIYADFDLVFTIFGPNYLRTQAKIEIVGFAQPWIIDKSAYRVLSLKEKIKLRTKFLIQSLFFRRADKLVVELEHVKAGLIKSGIAKPENIEVAHNCISSLYFDPSTWEPLSTSIEKKNYSIGFLGRDYPHKNTKILPAVQAILKKKHKLNVDFFVTLNDSEWSAKSLEFKDTIHNVGALSVAQCPSFYDAMDAIIFPSLLECFSATPLEALAMQKPLFASDRGFVRDVCGDFARYFDPFNPESAADAIREYISRHEGNDGNRLAAAREHVLGFSSARGRAERYLEIIRNALAERS